MQKSRSEIKLIKKIEVKVIIEARINKKKHWICILNLGVFRYYGKKIYGRDIKKRRCLYNKHVNRNEKHYCHFNKR